MSKADKLRAAGRDAGTEGLTGAQVVKIAGHQAAISSLVKTGEFSIKETPDGKRYVIDPDYTKERKTRKALPIKRRAKKKKRAAKQVLLGGAAKPARKPNTIRDIAARLESPPLRELAMHNLIAASINLRQMIVAQVEGLEDDPLLTGAINMARNAEGLAGAA